MTEFVRQFRNFQWGEHIVVGGDCSQGGHDQNWAQFISKNRIDVPLVYQKSGVAAEMTADIYPILVNIHKQTGVKPTVAFERQMGGASEMDRLNVLNRDGHYDLFEMPQIGQGDSQATSKLGWDTNTATRSMILGDLKNAINNRVLTIYDALTVRQFHDFIINKQGKPEAAPGKFDDAVMALAIAYQLFLRVELRLPLGTQIGEPDSTSFDKHAVIPII